MAWCKEGGASKTSGSCGDAKIEEGSANIANGGEDRRAMCIFIDKMKLISHTW